MPTTLLTNEQINQFPVLDDDYVVHWDYVYIADGRIVRSDIKGNIAYLRRDLQSQGISANVIRRFDFALFQKIQTEQ